MRMVMDERNMAVDVCVWFFNRSFGMFMLMVVIVHVDMGMLDFFMDMDVMVMFSE